ncbi:MAG: hypothetical protein Q7T07_01605 [Burkholderiaceae bacterium]|nr:hypothetical protein [Burkholderiaceae bacterium]
MDAIDQGRSRPGGAAIGRWQPGADPATQVSAGPMDRVSAGARGAFFLGQRGTRPARDRTSRRRADLRR